jgi:hypothetical protein
MKIGRKDLAYQPTPLFSAENLKSSLRAAFLLLGLLLGCMLMAKAASYFFPGINLPSWALITLWVVVLMWKDLPSAWSAWRIDPQSLDFDASQEVVRERASALFFTGIAALGLLFAYVIYPD